MCETAQWLPTETVESHRSALNCVFKGCDAAGFRIVKIHCDFEFEPAMKDIKECLEIVMHCSPFKAHVPEAERNNRTIEERVRSVFHELSCEAISEVMIEVLMSSCASKLNLFFSREEMSDHCGSHVTIKKEKLNHKKDFQCAFEQAVIFHENNDLIDSQVSQESDCIHLEPDKDQEHMVLDSFTEQINHKCQLTFTPITSSTIDAVEQMAARDKMKELRLRTETDQVHRPW